MNELADESKRLDLLDAGEDDYTAVRAVFSWSLRQLQPPVARAFTLLGLHPGADIGTGALAALTGTDGGEARALTRAHLLSETAPDRYAMHDLLRAYAVELAATLAPDVRTEALDRLRAHYLATAREVTADPTAAGLAWLEAERANLLAVATATTAGTVATATTAGTVATATTAGTVATATTATTADGTADHGTADHAYAVELSAVLAGYLDAHSHYLDALTLHELASAAATDEHTAGRAWERLGTVRRRLGEYDAAVDCYRRAHAAQESCGDRAGLAVTVHGLGIACLRLGRTVEAVGHVTVALDTYRGTGDRAGEGAALYALSLAECLTGRYADARGSGERALDVLREVGDRIGEGRALNNLGLLAQRLDDPPAARSYFEQSLLIARDVGNRTGESVALTNLGDLDIADGDVPTARERFSAALSLSRHLGYRVGQADALRGLGVAAGRAGRRDEAVGNLTDALAICAELGEQDTRVHALLDLGDLLHSLDHYREALRLASTAGDPYMAGQARSRLARRQDTVD